MGVDWLDIVLRIEKSFGIKIQRGDDKRLLRMPVVPNKTGARCGDLHDMVLRLCEEQGVKVPPSSWTRVKLCIMRACKAKAKRVRKDAWLHDDCGCT